MPGVSVQSSKSSELPTLGRLGGLAPGEADRGEKALWLAGSGYRAALFHLGALTRLNELGLLAQTGTVGAVAGGSIVAALLATRVPWPLHGGYREWPEQVAEPMRAIARRNARARAFLRKPFPGVAGGAALEERYARQLIDSLGGEPQLGPRFVFGASGLTLSGLAAGWEECVEWEIGAAAHPPGYEPGLVEEVIAAVRTDLDAFGEAEQAVLENHGYLLADAAMRERGLATVGGIEVQPPEPPHPRWMSEARVREALVASARRTPVGRLRPRRASRVERTPQPAVAELTALLQRHRPLLQYDSLESFRADSVATICELVAPGRCNTLHRAGGELIAAAAPAGGEARLDVDFLRGSSYPNGEPARHDDYLDECGGAHAGDAQATRRRQGCADVVYGHARHDGEGRLWLQYWFFYYYDDKGLLGLERHEGDWEMVQLRLGAGERPEAATFARHDGRRAAELGPGRPRRLRRGAGPRRLSRPGLAMPRCRGRAASRRPWSPTTTTASARGCGCGWWRSPTTARAGCSGRGAGERPGDASSSRPTARGARGSSSTGGTRRSCTAKRGRGSEARRRPGTPRPGRGSRPAARTAWRSSPTASTSPARGRGSQRGSSPRPTSTAMPSRATPARLRSRRGRAPSPCSCRRGGIGRGCERAPSPIAASAGETVAVVLE